MTRALMAETERGAAVVADDYAPSNASAEAIAAPPGAPVRRARRVVVERCGCCDALEPWAVCDACNHPMCTLHCERWPLAAADGEYICTICADERRTLALQAEEARS